MHRFICRTVYTARKHSASVYESCVLPAKCDCAAALVFRVTNGGGVKALSTSSVRVCEKKNDVVPSHEDEERNAAKDVDPTETATLVKREAEGDTTQQPKDIEIKQVNTTPQQAKAAAAKSGKKKILDLLAAMRVDVISKRKPKTLKIKQRSELPHKPKPEALESTISMFQKATVEASSQSETLDPELVAAASAAASTLPNRNQAVSELLKQLRQQQKGETSNLGVIISDMKVQKKPNRQKTLQSSEFHFDDDGQGYASNKQITTGWNSVPNTKRLNIFSQTTDGEGVESTVARPTLWDVNFARELYVSTNQNPRNGFEEMIQWTKEGKLWQYPINNEAGLEEEASVSFNEHIFLEKHLEEGFPRQGPVRHFMELVVTGLSRNPYLTVQEKKEHISWFRDYFHQKSEALKEVDVYLN